MSQDQGRSTPRLLGIHARPGQGWRWVLAALPFVLVIGIYLLASDLRHRENPSDKLLPRVSEMADAVERVAFTEDRRSGEYILWQDAQSPPQARPVVSGIRIATSG